MALGRRITYGAALALILGFASTARAATLTLAWDPNTESNLSGYTVHYGTAPGSYSTQVNTGNVPMYTITGLVAGQQYYFAVQAYALDGLRSPLSNEVSAVAPGTTPDTTPPSVTQTAPAPNAADVAGGINVVVTFSEAMAPASISTATIQLRDPANVVVPATVTYAATSRAATLDPTLPLVSGKTYTVSVKGGPGGVTDLAANPLANDVTWTFTSAATPDITPPTIAAKTPPTDATNVAPSAKSRATFSEAMNTATITASTFQLRNAANAVIAATVTYDATSRVATLTPAALLTPDIYRSLVRGGATGVKDLAGNALASDVVWSFSTIDTIAPAVTAAAPPSASADVSVAASVDVTFSEAMAFASISTATIQVRDPANVVVPATVTYSATNRTATLDPTLPLIGGKTYAVTVKGGPGGVTDLAANPLTNDLTWAFSTAAGSVCPCRIWSNTAVPAATDVDTAAVEVGVKFRADVAGSITGLRFYKAATNIGPHTGSLWTGSGTRLARVTFANETASGWQEAPLTAPVAIAANTTYVVSYHAPKGRYSVNEEYFATAGTDTPPLHALAPGTDGANGVYRYGAGGFPTESYFSTNYWVDVVFSRTVADGLIAALGFEDGAGTTARDSSGNAHSGVVAGAAWTKAGRFGKALEFDGLDDSVTVADTVALNLTTGMTLEAWVYPTALTGWGTVILKERSDGLAYGVYAHNNASHPAAHVNGVGEHSAAAAAQVPLNTWTHLAATYDGTTLRLYVNGAEVNSVSLAGPIVASDGPLRVGGNAIFGEYFRGRIDEIRIYNRAVTESEIQADMNAPVSP
jgi:uncharacterized protein DUF4082/concanavalin A-like lectin/glucanase superfamily protein/Big-like domain-containing protein/fibronectin type III domain protein